MFEPILNLETTTEKYNLFLAEIKNKIEISRVKAIRKVNSEMLILYWSLGEEIHLQQEKYGWGKSIIEKLSNNLQKEFYSTEGYSARNLWDMRRFYLEYKDYPNLKTLSMGLPWGQNLLILSKIKDNTEREYYLSQSVENGWTRNVLLNQIKADAYRRHMIAEKTHNFKDTLPTHLAEQVDMAIKDSYALDFIGVGKALLERELENKLVVKIKELILELGYGFAFIGNQYKISAGSKDYYLDLLFYHRKLKCLVCFELKTGEFKAEYAGKMNLYLNILDDFVKEKDENPSIGIILCAEKDSIEVEYALRGVNKPMGVSEYTLTKELPNTLKGALPTLEELKREVMEVEME